MDEYKKLKPFDYWCAQNIPAVFGQEMTYYEKLCRVIELLNDTISNVNLLHTEFVALNGFFDDLKAYVENYFKNLDVQQEIDNKIDAMVVSGEFDKIINGLFNRKVNYYDSVQAMASDINLIKGMTAVTLGYYVPNDGGGAMYKVGDGTTYGFVKCQNGNAVLINQGFINVKQYGVKSDGTDQSQLLVDILTNVPEYGIYFPAGTYTFLSPLTVNARKKIYGENVTFNEPDQIYNGTVLKFVGISDATLISCTQRCQLSNLYIVSDSYTISTDRTQIKNTALPYPRKWMTPATAYNNVTGVELLSFGSNINNCVIRGCSNYGVRLNTYNVCENVMVAYCKTGLHMLSDNVVRNIKFYYTSQCMQISGSLNTIEQIRADDVETYAIGIIGGNNVLNGLMMDYVSYELCNIQGGDNNTIENFSGRIGVSYYNADSLETGNLQHACYFNIRVGADNTRIRGYGGKRMLDGDTVNSVPFKAVDINGTFSGGVFDLNGTEESDYWVNIESGTPTFTEIINGITQVYNSGYKTVKLFNETDTPVTKNSSNIVQLNGRIHGVSALLLKNAATDYSIEVSQWNVNNKLRLVAGSDPVEITNVAEPTASSSAATKNYVDNK